MKKKIWIAIMALVSLTYSWASSQENKDGKWLLSEYGENKIMTPEENKIGLKVDSIYWEKEGESFNFKWSVSPQLNQMFIATRMYFIDPIDTTNIKNGVESRFRGRLGSANDMIVTMNKPTNLLILYFEEIEPRFGIEYATPPLFFMIELGDVTQLLESNPRHAGDLFKQIVARNK